MTTDHRIESPEEVRARHRASWERLSGLLRERAVRAFLDWCPEQVRDRIKAEAQRSPLWFARYHFGWGMGVRNMFRTEGRIFDLDLPGTWYDGSDPEKPETWPKNWDDYYVGVIEGALGLYEEARS